MSKLDISRYAGAIFYLLESRIALGINDLVRLTGYDKEYILFAIGWLARENRIIIRHAGDNDLYVSLNCQPMTELYLG